MANAIDVIYSVVLLQEHNMISRAKMLFTAAIAAMALVAAAGTAGAASFSVSPGGAVDATSGSVTFDTEAAEITCALTLENELVSGEVEKVAGTSIGTVVGVQWASCSGGNVREVLLGEEGWDLTYSSIAGTLPEGVTSTTLTVNDAAFQFSIFFGLVNCLYSGDVDAILSLNHSSGSTYTTGTLRADENDLVSYVSGPEACPRTGNMSGTFRLSSTQTLVRS